jgi:chromosomal replication initiation ATPase DnaA
MARRCAIRKAERNVRDPSPVTMVIDQLRRRGLWQLVEAVCERRGVTPDELCGRARTRSVARARHELWWMIRALPDRHYSYTELGRMFRCNPATILQGIAVHERLLAAPAS